MRVVTARTLAIAIAIATSWGTSSQAVNIFSNPITDGAPQTFNPFTAGQTFDSNITVTGIGRGSGVGANAASNRYNANNWAFPGFDDNDYFTFTLTPNSGYEIDFASITGTWQRSNTGPKSYLLKTSLDNFATTVTSGDITGNASAVAYNVNLSSIQNVTAPIEIRLYAGGNTTNGATGGTFSFNDFTFDGSVNAVSAAGNIVPASSSVVFPKRIVNVAATQAVTLNETGGLNTNYTSSTSADAIVTAGDSGSITANGTGSITVGINASSAGAKSGTVTINDGNPTSDQIAVSGDVYDPSSAAFLSNGTTSLTVDLGSFAQGSGSHSLAQSIYNKLQTAGFTAELDFDSVAPGSGDVSVLSTNLTAGAFTGLAASDAGSPTLFSFNAILDANRAPGSYSASYQLALSDANSYVGAGGVGSQTLTLNLTGTIEGAAPGLSGDYNSDGVVNASDYVVWRKNETANNALPNDNGLTTQAQRYGLWRANFGNAGPGSGSQLSSQGAAVPEPQSAVLLLLAFVVGFDCYLARRQSAKRTTRFAV